MLKLFLIAGVLFIFFVAIFPLTLFLAGVPVVSFGTVNAPERVENSRLWRSQDGGVTWRASETLRDSGDQFSPVILDLAFHPVNSAILYIGSKGGGLLKSTDAGHSWTSIIDSNAVFDAKSDVSRVIAVSSRAQVCLGDILYVAAYSKRRGHLLKSIDEGRTFQELYFTIGDGVRISAFEVDETLGMITLATSDGGLFASRTGGASWQTTKWFDEPVARFIGETSLYRSMVMSSSGKIFGVQYGSRALWEPLAENLYAMIGSGPFFTRDGWSSFFSASFLGSRGFLEHDPRDRDTLYYSLKSVLWRSINGGYSWKSVNLLVSETASEISAFAADPHVSGRVIFAAGGQIHTSIDRGKHWSMSAFPSRRSITRFFMHPIQKNIVFAITQ